MKSIFKKQKLFFISLIGIVLTSSFLVFSYAYQKVKVDYSDTSKTGMSLSVGKLDVNFTTTNRINLSNIPLINDYKSANYTEFTIDNTNSTKDIFYRVKLSSLEYTSSLVTEDFKYTLTEVISNNETVIGSGDFRFLNLDYHNICFNQNLENHIDQGKTKKLRLYLWIKETNQNQNNLENSSFKGKIEINSYLSNEFNKLTLSNLRIYGNSVQEGNPSISAPIDIVSVGENGKNLFDKNNIDNEHFLLAASGNLSSNPIPNGLLKYCSSDYIKVKPSTKYIKSGTIGAGVQSFYNSNFELISYASYQSGVLFSTPSNCSYVKFNIDRAYAPYGDIQLEELIEGTSATEYVPYNYIDIYNNGKNIFNYNFPHSLTKSSEEINENSMKVIVSTNGEPGYITYSFKNLVIGQNYTMSFKTTRSSNYGGGIRITVDGVLTKNAISLAPGEYNYTFTAGTTNTIALYASPKSSNVLVGNYAIFSNIQLEQNSVQTKYEPYNNLTISTINLADHQFLRKVGDIADYIDLGAGKLIRKIGVIKNYNGEAINTDYISTTGGLDNGATIYYILNTEVVEDVDSTLLNNIYNSYYIGVDTYIKPSKIEFSI